MQQPLISCPVLDSSQVACCSLPMRDQIFSCMYSVSGLPTARVIRTPTRLVSPVL